MTGKSVHASRSPATDADGSSATRRLPLPTSAYTVFLALLNLAALSVAFVDPKGLVFLLLTLAYTVHARLLLTQREAQRRTNELLEELLDSPLR